MRASTIPAAYTFLAGIAIFASWRCVTSVDTHGHPSRTHQSLVPVVVNTWTNDFARATETAWDIISSGEEGDALLDAIEAGCNKCEDIRCGGSVGYGGHPDGDGEVTLDSMVMYGPAHSVGAVGCLRRIKNAATVARAVMEHTEHTMLAGEGATAFATMLGLKEESLKTDDSESAHDSWVANSCQPNYFRRFDQCAESCPPYPPPEAVSDSDDESRSRWDSTTRELTKTDASAGVVQHRQGTDPARLQISESNHDTIGIVVVSSTGDLACGTTTNGAANKIPGRVGDSPIAGAGCYVDNDIGGAAATGDGDVMMRFLPSFRAVESMLAATPQDACLDALCKIAEFYPTFGGALICVNKHGEHGAARHGLSFSYSYQNADSASPQIGEAVEADEEACSQRRSHHRNINAAKLIAQ